MTTLSQIAGAAQDPDLAMRLGAAAAVVGVPDEPMHWTYSNAMRLAAQEVGGGQSVASHHAAGTLTDEHLLAAVRAVAEI